MMFHVFCDMMQFKRLLLQIDMIAWEYCESFSACIKQFWYADCKWTLGLQGLKHFNHLKDFYEDKQLQT